MMMTVMVVVVVYEILFMQSCFVVEMIAKYSVFWAMF